MPYGIAQSSEKVYFVSKSFEFSAAHKLTLSYESKCTEYHGHNWRVKVECRAETLNENGMVVDFTHIKQLVLDRLDHKVLNDVLPFNPTAENIARWIVETVPNCYRAEVQESEGNTAAFEID